MAELDILYEDRELLVAVKPAGVESEAARGLEPDMVNRIRNHLAGSGREPYVGVIHRLDKPVSGIMVFAKSKESAAALSKELRDGKMQKKYRAILCGQPKEKKGTLTDWLVQEKQGNRSRTGTKGEAGAKEARLRYTLLRKKYLEGEQISEVEIELLTGRHHQIRVQFAARGLPLMGDRKYNPAYEATPAAGLCGSSGLGKQLCLCAYFLSFTHPKSRKRMQFSIEPPCSL